MGWVLENNMTARLTQTSSSGWLPIYHTLHITHDEPPLDLAPLNDTANIDIKGLNALPESYLLQPSVEEGEKD